jgi:hypothetical protein
MEPQSSDPGSLELTDVIETTAGPPPTRSFYLNEVTAGPGGCLFEVGINLGNCLLQFGPPDNPGGALVLKVPPPGATGLDNQGWCPTEGLGTALSGTLTFDGVSCQGPAQFAGATPGYCYAGVFELRLTSQPPHGTGAALTGTPFHLQGAACPIDYRGMATGCQR